MESHSCLQKRKRTFRERLNTLPKVTGRVLGVGFESSLASILPPLHPLTSRGSWYVQELMSWQVRPPCLGGKFADTKKDARAAGLNHPSEIKHVQVCPGCQASGGKGNSGRYSRDKPSSSFLSSSRGLEPALLMTEGTVTCSLLTAPDVMSTVEEGSTGMLNSRKWHCHQPS